MCTQLSNDGRRTPCAPPRDAGGDGGGGQCRRSSELRDRLNAGGRGRRGGGEAVGGRSRIREAGESLLEVTAAVVILAAALVPAARLMMVATAWLNDMAAQEQALAYAEQGVQYVRQFEQSFYNPSDGTWTPQPVSPQPLPPVRGVSFTESISNPTPAPWGSNKVTLYQWTVTVTWVNPSNHAQRSVSLTAVVNPALNG